MNISSLARKLKITPNQLKDLFIELGFDIGKRAIQIDDKVAEKFEKTFKEYQIAEKNKQKFVAQNIVNPEATSLVIKKNVIKIPNVITVSDLAKKLNLEVVKVITELMKNGIMAAMHERLDYETAEIIALDLGFKVVLVEEKEEENNSCNIKKILENQDQSNLKPRPPVVVVMGHVDHGKTTLLDFIRKTAIADLEIGGITQSIGAYQTEIHTGKDSRLITFLDTPGHEAFKGMRSRGGRIADIAVLVIAADDGIKPQTLESIEVIQKENLHLIIAINKIDKEGANINKVKQELSSLNLTPEDWGGKTICLEISAKFGKNIDKLLETIVLVADLAEIKADSQGKFLGTIIETNLDKGLGPTATILVHNGALKIGDYIKTGTTAGKIKAMIDFKGGDLTQSLPGTPVKILGLKKIPSVGDLVEKIEIGENIKKINKQYKFLISQEKISSDKNIIVQTLEDKEKQQNKNKLDIILKSDTLGGLEAVLDEIEKIRHPMAEIRVVKKGLGNFTEKDVILSEKSKAQIIGFRTALTNNAKQMLKYAQREFKNFHIIYELLDYLKAELEKLLPPEIIETNLGQIKTLACFSKNKDLMIIGGKVISGKIKTDSKFKILHNDKIIGQGKITEIQHNKRTVLTVSSEQECGLKVKANGDIQEGDILKCYEVEKRKRKL